jgi:predicted AAA+ superfamily ATPase
LSKELERILERLDQLLPPLAPPTAWDASIAFRWRTGCR